MELVLTVGTVAGWVLLFIAICALLQYLKGIRDELHEQVEALVAIATALDTNNWPPNVPAELLEFTEDEPAHDEPERRASPSQLRRDSEQRKAATLRNEPPLYCPACDWPKLTHATSQHDDAVDALAYATDNLDSVLLWSRCERCAWDSRYTELDPDDYPQEYVDELEAAKRRNEGKP